ncbi:MULTISPECIES: transcriptional regulator [unclassified Empedobacter]|uniref:transcriptional regulator n=1 Tax=unclassified Empedobacter TaxID=2643773 RepID=UPI0025BCDD43|nr:MULTISPECIES: transcriptional regulator [unclassified Empedobacter]
MNYIKHLSFFFQKVQSDPDISPSQISIYLALFNTWNRHQFSNPIVVIRDEIMRLSKIMSKSTYHRSMKILHDNGYIIYKPSYNPFLGSKVYLIDFTKSAQFTNRRSSNNNQAVGKDSKHSSTQNNTALETPTEKGTEPFIKHINNKTINNKNCLYTEEIKNVQNFETNQSVIALQNNQMHQEDFRPKEKSSAKKEKVNIPTLEQAKTYFKEKGKPTIDAEKFFYYFESVGWLVGGKTKMKNWRAAANNWMINAPIYAKNNTFGIQKPLDTSVNKRYDEPL